MGGGGGEGGWSGVTQAIRFNIPIHRNKTTGLEVIKLEYSLRFKIKRNDWLLADTCPQAANQCA